MCKVFYAVDLQEKLRSRKSKPRGMRIRRRRKRRIKSKTPKMKQKKIKVLVKYDRHTRGMREEKEKVRDRREERGRQQNYRCPPLKKKK